MRKVKFTQQNYHDKLTTILTDFPRLEVRKTRGCKLNNNILMNGEVGQEKLTAIAIS